MWSGHLKCSTVVEIWFYSVTVVWIFNYGWVSSETPTSITCYTRSMKLNLSCKCKEKYTLLFRHSRTTIWIFSSLLSSSEKIWGLVTIDNIWSAAQYVMSVVVFKIYDVSYDTRKIKNRKNMVIVLLLAATKEKKTLQDIL